MGPTIFSKDGAIHPSHKLFSQWDLPTERWGLFSLPLNGGTCPCLEDGASNAVPLPRLGHEKVAASPWCSCCSLPPSPTAQCSLWESSHLAVRKPELVQVKRPHEKLCLSQQPTPTTRRVSGCTFRRSQPPAFRASSWDPDIAEQTPPAILTLP